MLLEKLDGITPRLMDSNTVPDVSLDDNAVTGECLMLALIIMLLQVSV